MKPRLLDLFCGAGGCTAGYQRAGFWVRGVDNKRQPRYCGEEFIQADALEYLSELIESGEIEEFDAIHASPPCQGNLKGLKAANRARKRNIEYFDLIPRTRELCQRSSLPYAIENVEGANLVNAAKVCGSAFDLGVRRHRYFESDIVLFSSGCRHSIWREAKYPTNFRPGGKIIKSRVVQVYGNTAGRELWPHAMGIDWMASDELSQAIPPAYTEFIGRQLIAAIDAPLSPGKRAVLNAALEKLDEMEKQA
jgi:DNA (cytosine-5)-methyltransferase 1